MAVHGLETEGCSHNNRQSVGGKTHQPPPRLRERECSVSAWPERTFGEFKSMPYNILGRSTFFLLSITRSAFVRSCLSLLRLSPD